MAWARLDDQFPDHPKVIAAGPLAKALFVDALCYCNRLLTDGLIPRRMALRLAADYAEYTTDDLIERLIAAGLWDNHEDGYQVHDFLDYQPSAEKVKAERAQSAKRQADYRNRHSGSSNGVTHGVTHGPVTPAPYPSRPVPNQDNERAHTAREGPTKVEVDGDTTPILDMFAAYAVGAGIGNGTSEWHTRQLADLPALRTAVHAGLGAGKLERMARYVAATWLTKGITVTPEVAKVLKAESEFDRWEAAGCPAASARAPTGISNGKSSHVDRANDLADYARQLRAGENA